MSSFYVTLHSEGASKTHDFTIPYQPAIDLGGFQYRVALTQLNTSYSWYNISAKNGNNTFAYNNGVDDKVITIDDGLYSFISLVDEIKDHLVLNGDATLVDGAYVYNIDFTMDLSSGYVSLLLSGGFTVSFVNRGIRTIFGFNSAVYNTSVSSPNRADINYGVNNILVHLNLVSGSSFVNSVSTDVIYSFSPVDFQPNEVISFTPNPVYLNVNTRTKIPYIRVRFTDQLLREVDLNSAPVVVQLHFEPLLD